MKQWEQLKQHIFEVIQPAEKGRIASKVFDLVIMALIVFSVVSAARSWIPAI